VSNPTPLGDLPQGVQDEVRLALESDQPPPKYKYFGDAGEKPMAAIVSRAWYEWQKRYRRLRKIVRRQRIIDRDGMTCRLCGDSITDTADLHIDHIIPVSRGGSSRPSNLQVTHAACNLAKGAKLL